MSERDLYARLRPAKTMSELTAASRSAASQRKLSDDVIIWHLEMADHNASHAARRGLFGAAILVSCSDELVGALIDAVSAGLKAKGYEVGAVVNATIHFSWPEVP